MCTKEASDNLNIVKSQIRKFTLDMTLEDKYDISFNKNRIHGFGIYFRKTYKIIKYINELGGVLVGSRALRGYMVGDKYLLDRKPQDWDFRITKKMAYKICEKFNIEFNFIKNNITIKNQVWTSHDAYNSSSTRHITCDIDLIIKEDLPSFKKYGKFNVSHLNDIINEKISLFENNGKEKHLKDLNRMMIKINSQ